MTDRKFKALIFDVGDILYDASQWRRWLVDELVRRGFTVSYPQLVEAWESMLVDVYRGNAEYWCRFGDLMLHFGLKEKQSAELMELAQAIGRAVQLDRKPMPEVAETLAGLRDRSVKLVALSDNESGEAGVRSTLSQLGIEQNFVAVLSSKSIGHVKPEPAAFDCAIRASGEPKKDCGFVAHDVDELRGAQQHGLFAIAYNHHPDAPADLYIDHFSELLRIVG